MTVLSSIDAMLTSDATYGMLRRALSGRMVASTAATANCGGVACTRADPQLTIPSLGTGITGCYLAHGRSVVNSNPSVSVIALEVLLATHVVGTGFTSGGSMPTRTIEGASVVTATMLPMVVCTNVSGATPPAFTITYTDQDGNGSQTSATVTLPVTPNDRAAYCLAPHLASGDTGVRSVSAISMSASPTTGTFKIYGLFPLAFSVQGVALTNGHLDPVGVPFPIIPLVAGDIVAVYGFGMVGSGDFYASMAFLPDY